MNLSSEIIVDNFAGGGGASTGIEIATGRSVDIAINHDPAAIAMHRANHPDSKHYCENVWDVDPVKACNGHKVALAWFSPDCKHFSKAKGGKPVDKSIRGLAWVAVKWARLVRPRVIMLENVEEFKTWGPLDSDNMPDKKRKGQTFNMFVNQLRKYGYDVDWRELTACDYGAPTIRTRFFMIARCDHQPIVWPDIEYGKSDSLEVHGGILKPWHEAHEIIDFSLECTSIFERKKPLCEKTMARIAHGYKKFIVDDPNPYIVNNTASYLIQYHGEQRKNEVRGQSLRNPLMVIDSSNRYALVTAFLMSYYGTSIGSSLREPLRTITARGQHIALVEAFLIAYYGSDIGQSLHEPLRTVTGKDRFGLVMVSGEPHQVYDIGMRMLTPRELFDGQGFPHDYIIDVDADGKKYPKCQQVARCGNAVPPPFATALTKANLPELCGNMISKFA